MMLYRVSVLLFIAGVILASPVERVCAPSQWRAHLVGQVTQLTGIDAKEKSSVMPTRAKHYTDYTANLQAFHEEFIIDGERRFLHTITDYNEMRMYETDIHARSCLIKDLPPNAQLKKFCEGDPELKLLTSMTLGGKMADTYRLTFNDQTMDMTVLRGSFTPVSAVLKKKTADSQEMRTYQYSDANEGILDRSVFQVPSYCLPPPKINRVCIPEQLELSAISQIIWPLFGEPNYTPRLSHHARDFVNKLEASVYLDMSGKPSGRVLYNWKNQTVYNMVDDKKICSKSSTPTPAMLEMCSNSSDLRWLESFSVDGKIVDEYEMRFSSSLTATIRVFRDTFELISAINSSILPNGEFRQMRAIQYGNQTVGISDPSIFEIPDYCM